MVNNGDFERQLRKLISEIQDELNKVENQIEMLDKRRVQLLDELHPYETSLKYYLKRIGAETEDGQPDWEELLKGNKTHKQRLIIIAEQNSGELGLNQATDIIYNGKFITSKKRSNAYIQLYQIVDSMVNKGELEKIGRGHYKLTQRGRLI